MNQLRRLLRTLAPVLGCALMWCGTTYTFAATYDGPTTVTIKNVSAAIEIYEKFKE